MHNIVFILTIFIYFVFILLTHKLLHHFKFYFILQQHDNVNEEKPDSDTERDTVISVKDELIIPVMYPVSKIEESVSCFYEFV
jgi:hypothetical protein